MGEEQLPEQFEEGEAGFDVGEIIALLNEYKDQGMDFEDEDFEHLRDMPPDEALEYAVLALESNGLDAMDILLARGIIKMERKNSPELYEFQKKGEGSYSSEEADRITLEDQKKIDEKPENY